MEIATPADIIRAEVRQILVLVIADLLLIVK